MAQHISKDQDPAFILFFWAEQDHAFYVMVLSICLVWGCYQLVFYF